MRLIIQAALLLLLAAAAGCARQAVEDNSVAEEAPVSNNQEEPSAVDSTVRTMMQYDSIQAGRKAQDRLKNINAERTADRNEVGID